jgi:antitoxin component HigA of HigAB toxin-antitoxin module
MNVSLLRSKMMLRGHRDKDLQEVLGLSRISISGRMTGLREFTLKDITKIAEYYKLTPKEVKDIFY